MERNHFSVKIVMLSFLKNQDLEVHEGNKRFECDVCGSRFARNAHLKGHVQAVHEGAKPFNCEYCDVSFSQKPHLKVHIIAVHERKKPYKCDLCNTAFPCNAKLINHKKFMREKSRSNARIVNPVLNEALI